MLVGCVNRQRKRKDRRKTLQTIALMVGVGLVVCGISFAVMIPVITHHKSHHNADNTNSILSLCEQKQYDQWCQGQVESAGNEWQALKDKYNDGTLTLVCRLFGKATRFEKKKRERERACSVSNEHD